MEDNSHIIYNDTSGKVRAPVSHIININKIYAEKKQFLQTKAIIHAYIYHNQEMLYAIAVMVFGKLLFGFILGSIASTLANLDTQRVLFEEKLFALKVG